MATQEHRVTLVQAFDQHIDSSQPNITLNAHIDPPHGSFHRIDHAISITIKVTLRTRRHVRGDLIQD